MRPLPARAERPITSNYVPELENTPELESDGIVFFQELIGVLRWAIEIGRFDIQTEVSILSSFQAAPRQGHLEQVIHIYLHI